MRYLLLAGLIAVSLPATASARLPSKGENIAAPWKFIPAFEEGVVYKRSYGHTQIGRMTPEKLFLTGSAATTGKSETLMEANTPLMATSNALIVCEPKRIVGRTTVACLVDTDGDGAMDSFFKRAKVQDMTQLVPFGTLKPLNSPVSLAPVSDPASMTYFDVILDLGRSQLDISDPSIRSRFCIYADHKLVLSGLYGKTRENCTYTYTQQLTEMPLAFHQFGYRFAVTDVQNDSITYSINGIK